MDANILSEICRICAERRHKFYKTEGQIRKVVFELLSEIADLQIVNDDRLPSSICCDCFTKLQNAKLTLDNLKKSTAKLKASNTKLEAFQCRVCLGAIKKNMAVPFDVKEFELKTPSFVCRSCASMLESYELLKSMIRLSNEKFMKEILVRDPLKNEDVIRVENLNESWPNEVEQRYHHKQVDDHEIMQKSQRKESFEPPKKDENFTKPSQLPSSLQIHCKSCNRLVSSSHYQNHLKSKFHSFFLEFPEHRSEKVKRQQKLSEYQLLTTMKIFCDACKIKVTANYWKSHLKLKKHLFKMKNPNLRPKMRKPKSLRRNFDEDLLASEPSKAMICDFCRRIFYKKEKLEIHLKGHAKASQNFSCHFCDEKFFTSSSMMSHQREKHVDENGNFRCDCGKKFKNFETFLRHKSTHKNPSSPFFSCDLCSKFKNPSKAKLLRHMRAHLTQAKKFVCEYCGIACKYRCLLNRHLANVHGIGKIIKNERHYCDRCEKSYVDRKDLVNHIKYVHEGVVRQHKYFCDVCGLKFYKLNKCNKHLQSRAHMKKVAMNEKEIC